MTLIAEQAAWSESREMTAYRPGQKVELKRHPGIIDTVIAYDPMMVPPVILASDPQPRYPEELTLISPAGSGFNWSNPWSKVANVSKISIGHRSLAPVKP
jgi:hypothetical protein